MKVWKVTACLVFGVVLFLFGGFSAQGAGFSVEVTETEVGQGDTLEVDFTYDGTLGPVAAFRAEVQFDPTVLEYIRPQLGDQVAAGTTTTRVTDAAVQSVYTAHDGITFLENAETALSYQFRVREEASGPISLYARLFDAVDPQPAPLPGDVEREWSIALLPPPSEDARLLSLIPENGVLSPAFSPEQLEYTMSVPYEVTSLTFTAEAAEGASFWVNRKNLGSGGETVEFRITVTAEDGKTKQVYTVLVYREEKEESQPEESSDARLLSLTPAIGDLSPAFTPEQLEYTMSVPYEVTSLTFTAEAAEGASFWVNRKNLGSGGETVEFRITVTAEDGKTKQVYTVLVYREEKEESQPEESSDARLLSLTPAIGDLSPAFTPEQLEYTMSVPYEVTSLTFTAEAAEGASFWVNRKNLGSGGETVEFRITVTAEDGKTKQVYTVLVYREEKEESQPEESSDARLLSLTPAIGDLSPAFTPEQLEYTMSVPYEVTSLTFTAEAVEGATFWVNRKNLGSGGETVEFRITVTAEDEKTKQVYTVLVYREEKEESQPEESSDARLLSLTPAIGDLSPAFTPEQLEYTMSVPYEVTSLTFTAEAVEGATFWVNRKNLGSGGETVEFRITVTAKDGKTKQIYRISVYRREKETYQSQESQDARLLSLIPATGTLSPAFSPDRLEYTMDVPFTVTSMTFTGEPAKGATFRVNRKNLGAGGSDTVFLITVTAEDKETKQVYQVTVHRNEKSSTTGAGSITTGSSNSSKGSSGSSTSSKSTKAESSQSDVSSSPSGASSHTGEETLQEEETAVPVAAEEDQKGGGSSDGTVSGGQGEIPVVTDEENQVSLLPGMLILLAFLLFGFLSGPLSKWIVKQLEDGSRNYKPKHPSTPNLP